MKPADHQVKGHQDIKVATFCCLAGCLDTEKPCSPKVSLSTLLFNIKTHQSVRKSLFWHVYGSTSCFKIANNVAWIHFVAAISYHDWQPSWILILLWKIEILLINLLRFLTLKNSYLVYILQIYNNWKQNIWNTYFLLFPCQFSQPTFWKWPLGGYVSPYCHC